MSGVVGLSPRNDVDIRPASIADAAGIAGVHIRSWLAAYPDLPKTRSASEGGLARRVSLWSRRLQRPGPGSSILVAAKGERVCGFVYLGPSPDPDDDRHTSGQVLSIHVEPELTGGGIGGQLMARAVASLRAAGYTEATLWVVANNRRARGFYQGLGWRVDGARRRELLAVEREEGDLVEVVRYRLDLAPHPVDSS